MKFRLLLVAVVTVLAAAFLMMPSTATSDTAAESTVPDPVAVQFVAAPQRVVAASALSRERSRHRAKHMRDKRTSAAGKHRGASSRRASSARIASGCRGMVALTFDDGPVPTVTPKLTAVLKRLHVPATFFMVGSRVDAYPEVARQVVRRGFTIGNHTYAHGNLTRQSLKSDRDGLVATERAFRRAHLGPVSDLMRPPYGSINPRVRAVIRGLGLTPVLWNVDARDWTGLSPRQIAAGVIRQVKANGKAGSVVLQHDGVTNSPATLAAVPIEVRVLRKAGYCFTGLDRHGRPVRH